LARNPVNGKGSAVIPRKLAPMVVAAVGRGFKSLDSLHPEVTP